MQAAAQHSRRNVPMAYIYYFCSTFGITSLWVMYLGQRGISIIEIGLIESMYHMAGFVFEIPSGILADRFSYKNVLIVSRILAIICSALMLFGHSFIWFALSFIIGAWCYNLQSGTLEAMIYESLPSDNRTSRYARIASILAMIGKVSGTVGVTLAGMMVNWHFEGTYVIGIALTCVSIVALFYVREPEASRVGKERRSVTGIIKSAISTLKQNHVLGKLMVINAFLATIASGYYNYFQKILGDAKLPSVTLTLIIMGSAVCALIALQMLPVIMRHVTQGQLLVGLGILTPVLLLLTLVNWLPLLIAVYMLINVISALLVPIFNTYLNKNIEDGQRATLLSFSSMLFSTLMIVAFPVIGFGITAIGFAGTFAVLGAAIILITVVGLAVGKVRTAR